MRGLLRSFVLDCDFAFRDLRGILLEKEASDGVVAHLWREVEGLLDLVVRH